MTKNTMQMCWWHPQREATYIVNLGTPLDKDTPACNECAEQVKEYQEYGPGYKVIPITRDIYDN